jgi:hypothetical protein
MLAEMLTEAIVDGAEIPERHTGKHVSSIAKAAA